MGDALLSLAVTGPPISEGAATVPAKPGLYGVHGSASAWNDLGIAGREPGIPLYVGKAQKSLAPRDVRVHFGIGASGGSTTGQSTLRRSLAEWMHEHLRLATWVMPAEAGVSLAAVESAVISRWAPPLNLKGSPSPSRDLSVARARMAQLAREGTVPTAAAD